MGRIGTFYQGKTWRLEQALNLLQKEHLSPDEALALVDCGRMCTDRGAEILSSGRSYPEQDRVLEALLITSGRMLERVQGHLDESEMPGEIWSRLSEGLNEVQRESFFSFRLGP